MGGGTCPTSMADSKLKVWQNVWESNDLQAFVIPQGMVGSWDLLPDIGVDDMSAYQPHQVTKKQQAGLRHEAIARSGRIRPRTDRLRIDELAADNPVEIRTAQIDGTMRRIEAGKATQPPPA